MKLSDFEQQEAAKRDQTVGDLYEAGFISVPLDDGYAADRPVWQLTKDYTPEMWLFHNYVLELESKVAAWVAGSP